MAVEGEYSFGKRLRHLRLAAGLTQEDLAGRAGLTGKAIAALERGRRERPYPHTVRVLADGLGLTGKEREEFLQAVPRREPGVPSAPRPAQEAPPLDPGSAPTPAAMVSNPAVLPVPPTPLLGREPEMAELLALLSSRQARLLTLTGPGGVGKTRLAMEVARCLQLVFPDGVFFVTLAELDDSTFVLPTIVQALGIVDKGRASPAETLTHVLRDQRLLLVLDNFEHVLSAAPDVALVVAACPGLVVFTTSRSPLRVRGEQAFTVGPLALPELKHLPTADELAGVAAAQLFVERAQAASPSFALTRANAAAIAAICRRLDGLPLALELAAARVTLLSPTELLARLDRALPLLSGGPRDLPQRQRTMHATIEWSYNLLGPAERALFRRLTIFAGGWSLDATEEVGGEPFAEHDVLDLLSHLVEQSLVMVGISHDGRTRYRMLEPVREYARRRLEESGEVEEAHRCHARYYLRLTEQAWTGLRGPAQVAWLDLLDEEHANLRAAFAWLLAQGEVEAVAHAEYAIHVFWWIRCYLAEGRRWMETVLASGSRLSPAGRARALFVCGEMAMGQGDHATATAYSAEAYELFMAAEDVFGAAHPALMLGLLALSSPGSMRAEPYLKESARAAHEAGDHFWAALAVNALGRMCLGAGDLAQARSYQAEGLALATKAGDSFSRSIALYNQSALAQAEGDNERTAALFSEVLALSRAAGDRANVAYCLEGLAEVAIARGELERGARLVGAAQGLLDVVGARVYTYRSPRPAYAQAVAATRAALGESAWTEAWEQGRALSLDQAVEFALSGEEVPRDD